MNFFKTVFIVFPLLVLVMQVHAQEVNHWESVVLSNNDAKYFPGTSAPDSDWKSTNFSDDTWLDGKCAVGYGDGDDLTVIDPVISVYLRTEFTIIDKTKIARAILNMDYDDGFVAYLNGLEIARANVGTVGVEPSYNTVASGNHEALLYSGGIPEAFSISSTDLSTLLKDGINVLAVQVHNVVSNSSDMTCMPFLSLGITDESNNYSDTPAWFVPPVEDFTSSRLPILIIDTEGGISIPDEPKVNATLRIAYNKEGNLNYVDGPYHESSGPIGIEMRGNVTQGFPKKPYTFETRDSLGNNRNVKICGLPAENDWILRACYLDKTLMRNAIACQMSIDMGRYASRYVFCEVILNGSYDGVYLLMEQIKRDKNRVDIEELHPWTTDPDSIMGGYIYEVSQSADDFGERRGFRYPDAEDVNIEQYNYIKNYDDSFRAVMNQTNYADPKTGYPKWIDVQAFIDEIIVQEATKNCDAYGWSSYFFKSRWKKLAAGPVWDFDQALSNSTWNDGSNYSEWILTKSNTSVPTFWAKLFNEPVFKYLLKKRWFELRQSILNTDTLMNFIDRNAELLDGGAQQRNFQRWPILGVELWRSLPGWAERDTYQKEVDYMKTFFVNHLNWMDQQLASVPDQVITVPDLTISEIMYSAYNGPEQEYLKIDNTGDSEVDLTGFFFSDGIEYSFEEGQTLAAGNQFIIASDPVIYQQRYGSAPDGMYHGQLENKGEKIELQNSYGVTIDVVSYTDTLPWPVSNLENTGSIALIDLYSDNSLPQNWEFVGNNIEVPNLVISEIMYEPAEGSDYEFVEIVNAGDLDVEMAGIFLSDAISYNFPDDLILGAGEIVVVASNTTWFESKYGFTALGNFTGKLDNNGDQIVLQNIQGGIIDVVKYNDVAPWPIVDPVNPRSIELIDINSDNALGENWVLSETAMGTPMNLYNTGLDQNILSCKTIHIYPNPASDILNIRFNEYYKGSLKIELYDMIGSLQLVESKNDFNGDHYSINISNLSKGTYILKVNRKNLKTAEKVVITR